MVWTHGAGDRARGESDDSDTDSEEEGGERVGLKLRRREVREWEQKRRREMRVGAKQEEEVREELRR